MGSAGSASCDDTRSGALASMRSLKRLSQRGIVSLLISSIASVGAAAGPPTLPTTKAVAVEVDITSLPASEQAALVPIIRAAREMDALYMRQVWPGTRSLIQERRSVKLQAAQAELDALNFFKGPWGPNKTAFISGVPSDPPMGDYYPLGATKSDIDKWLKTLPEPTRKTALSYFTAIEQAPKGTFRSVPYSDRYRDRLIRASDALLKAAALTHEPTLKKFLALRAEAMLNDNYYASDVAFVGLKGSIDAKIGPYEVDDDSWFGAKAAYEASVALVNTSATQRISSIASHLQELEDHLPLASELRGRKLAAAAPIVVLDVIYHGGRAGAGGAEAGYGLPNDLRVVDAVGARTGTYSNILKLRYDSTFRPIADAVLTDAGRSSLRFEDIRDEVMFVRIFDSLGPQFVTGTKRPIAEALGEDAAVANQIRSMLLSLWGHRYLIEHHYLNQHDASSLYSAFLIPALARVRSGLNSTPSQGSTYVLNHLLQAGAISVNSGGGFEINPVAADNDISRAAAEFISPMAMGDSSAVKSLLRRYVMVTPILRDALRHLPPAPPLQRPIYVTADRISPVATN